MVAIFQNGRRNIHVLISQFLIHIEKKYWCLNIHFLDQGLQKDIYEYADLIFDHYGSHFFQNGLQIIHALISQFLIDFENRSWCLNIHFRDQVLHKRQ